MPNEIAYNGSPANFYTVRPAQLKLFLKYANRK